jgi:hypothetical protein
MLSNKTFDFSMDNRVLLLVYNAAKQACRSIKSYYIL